MMLSQIKLIKSRHRAPAMMLLLLRLTWCLISLQYFSTFTSTNHHYHHLTSALYLGPQQQVTELANNGAIIQALSQFAAQQAASGSGMPPGGLQVAANTAPNGAISIASSNNQTSSQQAANSGSIGANSAAATASHASINSNQFVIKWIHDDPKNQMAYVQITPVNYTNLHEPRIELRYQSKYPFVNLNESSANNTVVAAVVVQDEDSGPNGETSLSIEQGNELGHFKLVSTPYSNTIQVNGAPLSRDRIAQYNLTIVARDHGSPPKSSSSNLVIKLHASLTQGGYYAAYQPGGAGRSLGNPASYNALDAQQAADLSSSAARPPVTDLMFVGTTLVLVFAAAVILIIFGCAILQRPTKPSQSHHHHPHHLSASNKSQHSSVVGSHKNLVTSAPMRTSSAANSRIMPPPAPPVGNQCSTYCLSNGYNRTNL